MSADLDLTEATAALGRLALGANYAHDVRLLRMVLERLKSDGVSHREVVKALRRLVSARSDRPLISRADDDDVREAAVSAAADVLDEAGATVPGKDHVPDDVVRTAIEAARKEQPTSDLDPRPYRAMMSDARYASRAVAPNSVALVFDPRRQYEQDEVAYFATGGRLQVQADPAQPADDEPSCTDEREALAADLRRIVGTLRLADTYAGRLIEEAGWHRTPDDVREAITDEALWDFASNLLSEWNIEDANEPSLIEDFRDRFVSRFEVRPHGKVTPTVDEWVEQMDAERARQIAARRILAKVRPHGTVTEAKVDAALTAFAARDGALASRDDMRAALEAAREVHP